MENFNLQYVKHPAMDLIKEYLLTHGKYKEIKKKEQFAVQGFLAKRGAYIEDGLFRYTKVDARGDEHIVGYAFAEEFLGGLTALIEQSAPSPVTIEAVRDSRIYYLPFQELECFFAINSETQQARRILVDKSYLIMYSRLLDFYCKNTEELYLDLLNRCPNFQDYITLKEIASFLHVTPETISHIRKKLGK